MDATEIEALRDNFTVAEDQRDHLLRCWIHSTSCQRCLGSDECSWCPFVSALATRQLKEVSDRFQTWSCVPNSHNIQFLAPAYEEQVCPAESEQWELRTQPLGCDVSSITAVTAIVSITGTLLSVLLVSLTVLAGLRVRRYALQRRGWRSAWVRQCRADAAGGGSGRETEPLLPQQNGGVIAVRTT